MEDLKDFRERNFRINGRIVPGLKTPKLEAVTKEICDIGLSSSDVIQRALILPLGLADKLPTEVYIDWYEKGILEMDHRDVIRTLPFISDHLPRLIDGRKKHDRFAQRAAAVAVETLLRCSEEPIPGPYSFRTILRERVRRATESSAKLCESSGVVSRAIRSLRPHYKMQGRISDFEQIAEKLGIVGDISTGTTSALKPVFDFYGETDALGWTARTFDQLMANFSFAGSRDWMDSLPHEISGPKMQLLLDAFLSKTYRDRAYGSKLFQKIGERYGTQGPQKHTLAHRAALAGKSWIFENNLLKEDELNKGDFGGRTPLALAAWHGYDEVVSALITGGVDITSEDKWEMSALHLAALRGQEKIAKMLLKRLRNCGDDYPNRVCRTLLFYATLGGHAAVMRVLLKTLAGSEDGKTIIATPVKYGKTLREIAESRGHDEVLKLLESFPIISADDENESSNSEGENKGSISGGEIIDSEIGGDVGAEFADREYEGEGGGELEINEAEDENSANELGERNSKDEAEHKNNDEAENESSEGRAEHGNGEADARAGQRSELSHYSGKD